MTDLSSLISRVEEGSELASASVRPEPIDVSDWRKAMEGVTSGEWYARNRFVSAVGGVDTCEGAVHGTIIVCEDTWQADGDGRFWATSGDAERNAAWVARCSPDAIAKLLDTFERNMERAAQWAGSFGAKCSEHQAALRLVEIQREALEECEEYFDNRADADCDQDGFIPNKEMRLLSVVRTALQALENGPANLADAHKKDRP